MSKATASKFPSFVKLKCPCCHHGNLFEEGNLYNINKVNAMPKHCPVCGADFFPEPGFYYGAMYISYAMTVGICLVTAGLEILTIGFLPNIIIGSIIAMMLLLYPFMLRYSRAIWIYMFVKFNAEKFATAEMQSKIN